MANLARNISFDVLFKVRSLDVAWFLRTESDEPVI